MQVCTAFLPYPCTASNLYSISLNKFIRMKYDLLFEEVVSLLGAELLITSTFINSHLNKSYKSDFRPIWFDKKPLNTTLCISKYYHIYDAYMIHISYILSFNSRNTFLDNIFFRNGSWLFSFFTSQYIREMHLTPHGSVSR